MTLTATTSWVFRFWHFTTWPKVPWPRTSRIRYRFLGDGQQWDTVVPTGGSVLVTGLFRPENVVDV